ncbi:ATP-binding protein [Flavobacterium psychrotrophum]|uniref:ATP-binding protein n=1 Tax=Flavobacterium psychrotrophum TaxID=2294119 RepID=UPI0013C422E6|nr:ATP-binding protein [Flavobacterium psychrotrophum]
MRHIIFQGPAGSGKTVQANKLAAIMAPESEVTKLSLATTPWDEVYRTLSFSDVLILDECRNAKLIASSSELLWDWAKKIHSDTLIIFTTQADCSCFDRIRFRIVQCSYSISREEYVAEPLTLNE